MTRIIFTSKRIEDGKRLLARLRELVPITAAFWVEPQWKFVLSSPMVDEQSSLPFYSAVQKPLREMQICSFGLDSIYAAPTNDPVAAQLALGCFASGPFTAYLDGWYPSVRYIGEGEDRVEGYAYHLERPENYLTQYEKDKQ